jgi:hypothetical protein
VFFVSKIPSAGALVKTPFLLKKKSLDVCPFLFVNFSFFTSVSPFFAPVSFLSPFLRAQEQFYSLTCRSNRYSVRENSASTTSIYHIFIAATCFGLKGPTSGQW